MRQVLRDDVHRRSDDQNRDPALTELTDTDLLERFKPLLFFDSKERYFAQSIEGEPDVIYGRIATEREGMAVARWLQYWVYYERDWSPLPWRHGHAGDWEGVQFLLQGNVPILAVYAQHDRGEIRQWQDTMWVAGTRPPVYVVRGRHSCRFEAGWSCHGIDLERADGKHPFNPVDPRLVVMPEDGWVMRDEPWGDDDGSPASPGHQMRWRKPSSWARYVEK